MLMHSYCHFRLDISIHWEEKDNNVKKTWPNDTESYKSALLLSLKYEVILITHYGQNVPIIVTELPRLSGTVSQLDENMLSHIFPNFDCKGIQRPSGSVDL